MLNKIYRKNI